MILSPAKNSNRFICGRLASLKRLPCEIYRCEAFLPMIMSKDIKVLPPLWFRLLALAALSVAGMNFALAADPPKRDEDWQREARIADFTRRMKEANYPALFEK